jgi:flagellar basal-body rod modification protein FlgD
MTTTSVGASAQTQNQTAAPTAQAGTDKLANQNVFLQLLVAQLKYQDPQKPADGTQFVTQLAQFTTLQEQLKSRTDLDGILSVLQTPSAPAPTPDKN